MQIRTFSDLHFHHSNVLTAPATYHFLLFQLLPLLTCPASHCCYYCFIRINFAILITCRMLLTISYVCIHSTGSIVKCTRDISFLRIFFSFNFAPVTGMVTIQHPLNECVIISWIYFFVRFFLLIRIYTLFISTISLTLLLLHFPFVLLYLSGFFVFNLSCFRQKCHVLSVENIYKLYEEREREKIFIWRTKNLDGCILKATARPAA